MRTVKVSLKQNPYKIIIGKHILGTIGGALKVLNVGQDAVIITNPVINKLYGKTLIAGLKRMGFSAKVLEVPEGERSKSSSVAIKLIEQIAHWDVKKKVFVIAFGGGVIGDLAGFVAAVYKRGIPYVQVPTTFLAQIDSAIGGKVAIDLKTGKNLVGAFYQPKAVFSDVTTLKSLDQRQILNGMAEAVKYGVIKDVKLFSSICKRYKRLFACDGATLEKVVVRCSQIKAEVVAKDEFETKGIRTILNFGHTLGHAVEAACQYNQYHHGEAVALGMRMAGDISLQLGLTSKKNILLVNRILDEIGLPQKVKKMRASDILRVMEHDKKFKNKKNRFVLMKAVGRVKVVEGVPQPVIKAALKRYMK